MRQFIKNGLILIIILPLFDIYLFAAETGQDFVVNAEDFILKSNMTVEYESKSDVKDVDAETIKHEYVEETEVKGINYVKRIVILSDGSKQASYFYKSDEGIIRVPAISSNEKTILIKLPLRVGTSWVHEDFIGSKSIKSDKKAEAVETIPTPLGDLKCIKIRQHKKDATGDDEDTFLWVAKRYGIVKIEMNKKSNEGKILKTIITMTKFEEK